MPGGIPLTVFMKIIQSFQESLRICQPYDKFTYNLRVYIFDMSKS